MCVRNRVTKTVQVEAKKDEQNKPETAAATKPATAVRKPLTNIGQKRSPSGVLAGVLGPKPKKMTTLEKSKLDWQKFRAKNEDGLAESLDRFAKSGDGYLAQQAFLERASAREYERELEAKKRRH